MNSTVLTTSSKRHTLSSIKHNNNKLTRGSFKTHLKLIIAMMFWGITFALGRSLTQNHHPFVISFYRFTLASIILLPAMVLRRNKLPNLTIKNLSKVFLLGLTGIFSYNFLLFTALTEVEAGRASVIIAINPTVTAILAPLFLKERGSIKKFLGVILAFSGAAIAITRGHFNLLLEGNFGGGEVLLFLAVISWVSYTIIGKITLKDFDPYQSTTLACVVGSILLFPFALQYSPSSFFDHGSLEDILSLIFMGAFSTGLGFIWYYDGIQKLGAAKAATFINFVPVFGIASGCFILKEPLNNSLIWGASLVIMGVLMVTLKTKKGAPKETPKKFVEI